YTLAPPSYVICRSSLLFLIVSSSFYASIDPSYLHSFPTRRSSDLALQRMATGSHQTLRIKEGDLVYITTTPTIAMETYVAKTEEDRKSTRLNSSHVSSSYAVFCLKKKIGIEVKLAFNYNGSNQDMQ